MNDISGRAAHDVAAVEVCVKDDVREREYKGGEKKARGCDSEAALAEKTEIQKDRKREIQIRAAFFQAISGPAVGFMVHLCD